MNDAAIIDRLERFAEVLPPLVATVTAEDARWKPPSGNWSVLEIVGHLADEEVEDFRRRLRMTLEEPEREWPRNDPEAWARERRYNEADLAEVTERFVRERRESVRWLRGLRSPEWSVAHEHPRGGPIRAGDLLCSWAAHDALHIRQIAKRLYELAGREGFDVRYAGEWAG